MKMDQKPVPGKKPVRPAAPGKSPAKKKNNSRVKAIIIGVVAVLLVFAAVMGFLVWNKYNTIQSNQQKANELYTPAQGIEDASNDEDYVAPTEKEEVDPDTGVISDFNQLHEQNKDVVGHLSIAGTKLNTPVVQTSDNEYYLNHTFFKKNALGVPFADYRATINPDEELNSRNITIYGHASKDGSYFTALKSYRDVSYYQQHPIINFDTIYGKGKYKIIGAFIANTDISSPELFNYHDYIDVTEGEFNLFLEEMNKRTYFTTGVDVKYGDYMISLSTCDDQIDSSLSTPYRMVVVARRVRPGESAKVDTSAAANNPNMIMPQAWVDKYGKANPFS